jgi:hypothetical protein
MRAVATINAESVCALATSLAKLRVAGSPTRCCITPVAQPITIVTREHYFGDKDKKYRLTI